MKRYWMLEIRKSKNLSQTELAKMCNVSAQTISNIENGRRTPSAWLAIRLADVLGCEIKKFYTDREKVASY